MTLNTSNRLRGAHNFIFFLKRILNSKINKKRLLINPKGKEEGNHATSFDQI